MANLASVAYPTLNPTPAIGGGSGLPPMRTVVPWTGQFSDQAIRGAAKINPAYAGDFISGRYHVQFPAPGGIGGDQEPLLVKNKVVSQALASAANANAWKKRTLSAVSNAVLFGRNKPQKPIRQPWNKKFIPPLALFNDASQWVNTLMFNRPMQRSGNGSSDPDLKVQYFTPPPIETQNYAAGTLNAQLQLGNLVIQGQQLTMSASNYFGGS